MHVRFLPLLAALGALGLTALPLPAEDGLPETWEVGDGDGGTFRICLMDGHFARTNYAQGDNGYLGERGFWRRTGPQTVVFYDSGWADVITEREDGTFTKEGFAPDTPLSGEPTNHSTAKRVDDEPLFPVVPTEEFVGVWKLQDEHGQDFFVRVKPDHTAQSTYREGPLGQFGESGVWRHQGNQITILYDSGWVDVIVFGDGQFRKFAYTADQSFGSRYNNESAAEKVAPAEAGMSPCTD